MPNLEVGNINLQRLSRQGADIELEDFLDEERQMKYSRNMSKLNKAQ